MTLKEFEKYFIQELSSVYEGDEARQLFYITAEHVSGISRSRIALEGGQPVSDQHADKYHHILQDLKTGRPIQHILAEAWFYGLQFKVNHSVLIPRPETEELVHWILETAKSHSFRNFLDVGTGSGCIAISLKKNMPGTVANAIDISSEALDIARENAISNGTQINFVRQDILSDEGTENYDLIVSNPPYITPKESLEMHRNVLDYEPELALFVTEEEPLIFYKSIADYALKHLNPAGYLFFEINEYFGKEMIDMLEDKGFKDIQLNKDMQGKDRMIRCTYLRANDQVRG